MMIKVSRASVSSESSWETQEAETEKLFDRTEPDDGDEKKKKRQEDKRGKRVQTQVGEK